MTTDDLVPQILAAIDQLEAAALAVRDAPADVHVITRPGAPQPTELEKLALKTRLERDAREKRRQTNPMGTMLEEQGDWDVVLRRCAAGRRTVQTCLTLIEDTMELATQDAAKSILRDLADSYGVASAAEPSDH